MQTSGRTERWARCWVEIKIGDFYFAKTKQNKIFKDLLPPWTFIKKKKRTLLWRAGVTQDSQGLRQCLSCGLRPAQEVRAARESPCCLGQGFSKFTLLPRCTVGLQTTYFVPFRALPVLWSVSLKADVKSGKHWLQTARRFDLSQNKTLGLPAFCPLRITCLFLAANLFDLCTLEKGTEVLAC